MKTWLQYVLPLAPAKYRLPVQFWGLYLGGRLENELRYLRKLIRNTDVAVDVGANEGLYAYRMSQIFSKVYAFEANPDVTENLRAYNPGNIEISHIGLSSARGEATLYIPVLNDQQLTGWASFTKGNCPDAAEFIERRVQIRTLDEMNIQPLSLLKVDVEGHELEVLSGARETLLRNKPVIIAEVTEHNRKQVRDFLSELGYRQTILSEVIGAEPFEDNLIYLPE